MHPKPSIMRVSARPDRAKKRTLAAHVEQSAFREFKILAAELSTTTDGALTKAVALLFEKYGKPVPNAISSKLRLLDLQ
jgi:hypothetical protein